jgi:hypothetical protein
MELLGSILISGDSVFGDYGEQITQHIHKMVAVTSVGICLSGRKIEGLRCFRLGQV